MIASKEQELFQGVEKAIRLVLNPSQQNILPSTMLIAELGAESIDFLDISCEMEKIFDVQMDFRRLFRAKRATLQGGALDLSVQDVVDHLKELAG